MAEINVVPYIDVTLVLLIIFMVTAPLLQTGVEVDLPKAQAKTVAQDNTPETKVLIRGDESVNYGRVVNVMAALKKANVPSVGLMTSPYNAY
jgi:biopolymer transport protein TolR